MDLKMVDATSKTCICTHLKLLSYRNVYIYIQIYIYISTTYTYIYVHYIYIYVHVTEGSLEVKLPTIWTVEKQR